MIYDLLSADKALNELEFAEHYIQANVQHISRRYMTGGVQYRRWAVEESEIAIPLDVRFGRVVHCHASIGNHLVEGDSVHPLDHAIAGAVVSTRKDCMRRKYLSI